MAPLVSPMVPTEVCSKEALAGASTYNIFIFGNLYGLQHISGKVAIGGSANFTSSGILINGDLAVAGNIYTTSGKVGGKLTIGGLNKIVDSFFVVGGIFTGKSIDFAQEKNRLHRMSTLYYGYTTTGTTTEWYSEIRFSGKKPGLNVLSFDKNLLQNSTGIRIFVQHRSATVLINVAGSQVIMKNFAIWISGTSRNKVLWNMPTTTNLILNGIGIQGSILAPNAHVDFSNGRFEGTIVANSWTGTGAGFDHKFNGCLLIVP